MLNNINFATTGIRLYNVIGEENGEVYAVYSSENNARQVMAILKGNGLKDKLNVEDTGMYLDEIKIGNNRLDVNAETMTMRKLFANFANDYQVVHVTHPFVGERQVQLNITNFRRCWICSRRMDTCMDNRSCNFYC